MGWIKKCLSDVAETCWWDALICTCHIYLRYEKVGVTKDQRNNRVLRKVHKFGLTLYRLLHLITSKTINLKNQAYDFLLILLWYSKSNSMNSNSRD